MKKTLFPALYLLATLWQLSAQDVNFSFANAQNTTDGADHFYEVDVMVSSTAGFKLGSGQLYFNFNTAAFGDNIEANGKVAFSHPAGSYILGTIIGSPLFSFNNYTDFVTNDNTTSRVSFSWQVAFSAECLPANNVTATPSALFHIKIQYVNVAEDPGVCFESGDLFTNQTYTAFVNGSCGPTSMPGTQLSNDSYDCSLAVLPVELVSFQAFPLEGQAILEWVTASEINADRFEVQHSLDGIAFEKIGTVKAAGYSTEVLEYRFVHENPVAGTNYYRLRQVDVDDAYEYSDLRSVTFGSDTWGLKLYPNPAATQANLLLSGAFDQAYVQLFDLTGRLVLEEKIAAPNPLHQMDLRGLPAGQYLLKLRMDEKVITQKLQVSKD